MPSWWARKLPATCGRRLCTPIGSGVTARLGAAIAQIGLLRQGLCLGTLRIMTTESGSLNAGSTTEPNARIAALRNLHAALGTAGLAAYCETLLQRAPAPDG
jgi:hypothetical protein